VSFLDALPERYRVILCDVWGVVHDGIRIYPGAAERLVEWRREERFVLLVTNAPRTAAAVEAYLARLGLSRDAWDAIATSGDAGIAGLKALGRPVGFIGTASDRAVLEGGEVPIAEDGEFRDVAVAGFDADRPEVSDYRSELEGWAERGVRMHCLNPDRVVVYGGTMIPCAGAIADAYEALGGAVTWYGKPHRAIYEHALQLAGGPQPAEVLAIGDGLPTDILGAARMGFDAVFVTGGIHGGEPFPRDFAAWHDLGEWRPVAVVDSLG
jgi:HAD superfamily hydrolase (TIGR01459 family)